MIQSNPNNNLASIVTCLTSSESDDQSRRDAEELILNSISEDLFQSFIELIQSDQYQEQEKKSAIIVFSNILSNVKMIKNISNVYSIISEIYAISMQLIYDSISISLSHFSAILLIACVNSSINIANEIKSNLEITFFQDLFEGVMSDATFSAIHGFCFAICDLITDYPLDNYCNEDEVFSFLSGIISLLQNKYALYESQKKSISDTEDDHSLEACLDMLNLSKTLFEQDEVCDLLKENQQLMQEFIQIIFLFLDFHETFSHSIKCFASLVDSNQILIFSYLPQLIEVMINYINENNLDYSDKLIYDSVISICDFVYNLSEEALFLFLDLDFFSMIMMMCKIISIIPPNCDSISDWGPYSICQNALSNIVLKIYYIIKQDEDTPKFISQEDRENVNGRLNSTIFDLFSHAESLLSSEAYNDRSTSLTIFQILIANFNGIISFPVEKLIVVNDCTPRVRESSILCLAEFVSSLPDHRCSNDNQFSLISEIFEQTNEHINEYLMESLSSVDLDDCISISNATFYLLYYISLIPGFESLNELMDIIFYNLPFLLSNLNNSIFRKILKIIKNAHFGVINSFPAIHQLLFLILSNLEDLEEEPFYFLNCSNIENLIPPVTDIFFEYCERFGNKLDISDDLIHTLIDSCLSMRSCESTYPLALIGFVFLNNLVDLDDFNEYIQPLCELSLSLLQKDNEIYSDHNLKIFDEFSSHSILFFKYMILGDFIPEDLMENIFDLILPFSFGFLENEIINIEEEDDKEDDVDIEEEEQIRVSFDVQVYSMNLALLIAKKIPEFMACNGDTMMKYFASILNSYNFMLLGKMKRERLFKIIIDSIEIILSVFPQDFLASNYPMIISNFIALIIALPKQCGLNQNKIIKLFYHITTNFPDIVKTSIVQQFNNFQKFMYNFSPNQEFHTKIINILQMIELNN